MRALFRFASLTLLALVVVLTSGCDLFGSSQLTKITTDPPGAIVSVNQVEAGLTPVTVTLKDMDTVSIKKEGYEFIGLLFYGVTDVPKGVEHNLHFDLTPEDKDSEAQSETSPELPTI